jgi:uncharacterized protein YutE (UPF0331/DUF86 family)
MLSEKIQIKLQQLEEFVNKIPKYLPETAEEYEESEEKQLMIERLLQIIIEYVLDICIMLIKVLKLEIPKNEDQILNILKSHLNSIDTIKKMKGFRNILVHRYDDIDNSLVYQFASKNLVDFETFIREVKELIKE